MILWICKLVSTARRAIAGRRYPHQMAWGVAFGLLLGVIPHGNLLALLVLLVVLSLKVNHAMAALTAVSTTFLASLLDPYSDQVGSYVLTHPKLQDSFASAWQLPLVPWTDLNNTVVMGSFLIGVVSLVPVFALTYPLFRMVAPRNGIDPESGGGNAATQGATPGAPAGQPHQLVLVDSGHATVAPPHRSKEHKPESSERTADEIDFVEVDKAERCSEGLVAVETRIDVIRMKDHRSVAPTDTPEPNAATDQQPMDEALNYLLRQLRDSQQRKAA